MNTIFKELIGASSIPLILAVLANEDSYGYDIVQKVKQLSNGEIKWKEASIYPVLKKMEKGGMIKPYWKVTQAERPRKYYTILDLGREQLEQSLHEWDLIFMVLKKLWDSGS